MNWNFLDSMRRLTNVADIDVEISINTTYYPDEVITTVDEYFEDLVEGIVEIAPNASVSDVEYKYPSSLDELNTTTSDGSSLFTTISSAYELGNSSNETIISDNEESNENDEAGLVVLMLLLVFAASIFGGIVGAQLYQHYQESQLKKENERERERERERENEADKGSGRRGTTGKKRDSFMAKIAIGFGTTVTNLKGKRPSTIYSRSITGTKRTTNGSIGAEPVAATSATTSRRNSIDIEGLTPEGDEIVTSNGSTIDGLATSHENGEMERANTSSSRHGHLNINNDSKTLSMQEQVLMGSIKIEE